MPDQRERRRRYLGVEFFARDTIQVARQLIGAQLIVGACRGRIVETEAYTTDAASHAVIRSKQAALMRETFGHIYVYLTYGMYYCLNITTERSGTGAVLIRAVEPLVGIDRMIERRGLDYDRAVEQLFSINRLFKRSGFDYVRKLTSGPGRLTQAFGIDLELNGKPIGREIKIRAPLFAPEISTSPRIGITKATELEWRFYETRSPFVSKFKLKPDPQIKP